MRCNNCDNKIEDDEVRWAFEDPFCDECFNDIFTYCSACDCIVRRSEVNYNNSNDPICDDCHNDNYDDDAPDNPEVCEELRKDIIKLSRDWIFDNMDLRRMISVNTKDYYMGDIRKAVGKVHFPIYLFGVKKDHDYSIAASTDIYDIVVKNIPAEWNEWQIVEVDGKRRLGIKVEYRKDHREELVKMIQQICSIEVKTIELNTESRNYTLPNHPTLIANEELTREVIRQNEPSGWDEIMEVMREQQ